MEVMRRGVFHAVRLGCYFCPVDVAPPAVGGFEGGHGNVN